MRVKLEVTTNEKIHNQFMNDLYDFLDLQTKISDYSLEVCMKKESHKSEI